MKRNTDYNPFNRVRVDMPTQNGFDLSFDNKLTTDMGKLVPVLVQDTVPGDSFSITPEMLLRFAPLTFPIMHRIDATIHFFYVPNRILNAKWEKFLGNDPSAPVPPYIQGFPSPSLQKLEVKAGSLFDYLGMPLTTNYLEEMDALPILAYFKIYNEYYQDQNNDSSYSDIRDMLERLYNETGLLAPSDFHPLMADYADISECLIRAWEHDYFTSALPFAQKGDPVNIPLALGNIPVEITNAETILPPGVSAGQVVSDINGILGIDDGVLTMPSMLTGEAIGASAVLTGTINELRVAMQLQKFLEKNARSGTRYNELIRAHFGENIGDARINRPEYLGGIKNNIVISEVLQTASDPGSDPLGSYAGHATGVVGGNTINFHCTEHGWIMGILSVIPKTAYFQGMPRKFSRRTYLDYMWTEFSHLGEQAIKNKEIYYDNTDTVAENNATFGYIPRYSEYKYNPSEVHGDFRTNMLDFHLARNFASRPVLNEEFIYVNDDKRIFAVSDPDENSMYAHIYFNIHARRKIPFFTDPLGL